MSKALDGALAARRYWCRPDEAIRLVAGGNTSAFRFDVDGLSWEGHSGGRAVAERAERVVDWVDSWDEVLDSTPSLPPVVLFGPDPECAVMRAVRPWLDGRSGLWVLTSHRLGWLERPAEDVPAEDDHDRSWWGWARGFGATAVEVARGVADAIRDKPFADYEPHVPIPLAQLVGRVEFPVPPVLTRVRRRLPASCTPRNAHALRLELADGSGLEFPSATENGAERMHAMASGQR